MNAPANALFRLLPSVDEVLRMPGVAALDGSYGPAAIAEAARNVIGTIRDQINMGTLEKFGVERAVEGIPQAVQKWLEQRFSPSLTNVINATGVILHTNLGRAPLSKSALELILRTASEYSNLELDLKTGERGRRDTHVQGLFHRILNAATATQFPVQTIVVNNCAAAVLLGLNTLAEGGEVIVSRGELVEIGGSFRIPDVLTKSGAILREVGTTNRTRISDYEQAINEKTKLLLRVHRSNFAIVGFTEQPSLEELVALGRKHKIPVMEDLGNGALIDLRTIGVTDEPGVHESLRAGVDVVAYSGDKLLGGPQAGILSGRAELIAKMRSNPLFRALRVDKLIYAALEATLLDYLRGNFNAIPAVRMMQTSVAEIKHRADVFAASIKNKEVTVEVIAGESVIGGGTAPTAVLPTSLVAVSQQGASADELLARLRSHHPPIIARVHDGSVVIDLRTVFPEQEAAIADALK